VVTTLDTDPHRIATQLASDNQDIDFPWLTGDLIESCGYPGIPQEHQDIDLDQYLPAPEFADNHSQCHIRRILSDRPCAVLRCRGVDVVMKSIAKKAGLGAAALAVAAAGALTLAPAFAQPGPTCSTPADCAGAAGTGGLNGKPQGSRVVTTIPGSTTLQVTSVPSGAHTW
jgi:hypothetical protein